MLILVLPYNHKVWEGLRGGRVIKNNFVDGVTCEGYMAGMWLQLQVCLKIKHLGTRMATQILLNKFSREIENNGLWDFQKSTLEGFSMIGHFESPSCNYN